jgi:hypothetical protein
LVACGKRKRRERERERERERDTARGEEEGAGGTQARVSESSFFGGRFDARLEIAAIDGNRICWSKFFLAAKSDRSQTVSRCVIRPIKGDPLSKNRLINKDLSLSLSLSLSPLIIAGPQDLH